MTKKGIFNNKFGLLLLFIFIFIVLRSIHYIYYVNWSGDQGSYAIEALRLFKTKLITLIGPEVSANYQGRFIFQGPIIYYLFLLFLLIGKWDPVISSYLFMLFCSVMIIPLYVGVKKLIHEKAAWIMVIIYTLVPYYVNYSRFLWNSTLLFSLLPLLLFFMGIFKERKEKSVGIFFLISFWLGILLQFHYQFILVITGIFIYYFIVKKLKFSYLVPFLGGIALGFSPLIIFEVRHQFYHTRTIMLFIMNWSKVDKPGGITMPHYYLSLSFMFLVAVLGILANRIKRFSNGLIVFFAFVIGIYSFYLYSPIPEHAFWAPTTPWNYLAEKKIYDIIRSTRLKTDFNVANLAYYDTRSIVVKYFMKRDGYEINYDDYYGNKYLFVVSEGKKYLSNPSYEVATFKPNKILAQWNINGRYNMVLLERLNNQPRNLELRSRSEFTLITSGFTPRAFRLRGK